MTDADPYSELLDTFITVDAAGQTVDYVRMTDEFVEAIQEGMVDTSPASAEVVDETDVRSGADENVVVTESGDEFTVTDEY